MRNAIALTIFTHLVVTAPSYAVDCRPVLRRSIVDKNVVEKPAQLLITDPEEGKTSYAADLGFSLVCIPPSDDQASSLWEYAVSGEYHRNNLASKEQDSRIVSAAALGVVGNIAETGGKSLLPQIALKYKRDGVKDTKSVIAAGDLSGVVRSLAIGFIAGPSGFGFTWQPRIGLEYENVLDAEAAGKEGDVARLNGSIELILFPAQELLSQRLELSAFYQYWSDFSEDSQVDTGEDDHRLFKAAIRYYLDEDKHFAIGVERLNGENPTEGLPDQKYTQLAFQVRF